MPTRLKLSLPIPGFRKESLLKSHRDLPPNDNKSSRTTTTSDATHPTTQKLFLRLLLRSLIKNYCVRLRGGSFLISSHSQLNANQPSVLPGRPHFMHERRPTTDHSPPPRASPFCSRILRQRNNAEESCCQQSITHSEKEPWDEGRERNDSWIPIH